MGGINRHHARKRGTIVGVADTGTRSAHGAGLVWIDENFNVIDSLGTAFFDNHPSYDFPSVIVGTNYFNSIPIAYWQRGVVPAGKPNAGKWYMLMSDVPAVGFSANGAVFRKNGVLMNEFLFGTYRAFNDNGRLGSAPNKTHWTGTGATFNTLNNAGTAVGPGFHMATIQEFHEILARALIEKKTFNIWTISMRASKELSGYRGIEEVAFSGPSSYGEWRGGIRTDSSNIIHILKDDGSGSYVSSGVVGPNTNQLVVSIRQGNALWDYMFVSAQNGMSNYMIPDSHLYTANSYSRSHFEIDPTDFYGVFSVHCNVGGTISGPEGTRLAKI